MHAPRPEPAFITIRTADSKTGGGGGYYLGLYGETAIYVADTWSLRTMFLDPLGRKFRDALFNIEAVLEAKAEKARQEAHARGYQETLEKMSAMVGGREA